MKMVYIASPLRGDYNTNIKNAVEYCSIAAELGVLPMAPHIIFSQWCNDTIPQQREQGLQLGLSLLEKSEELWVMGDQISEGMKGEIAFAKEHDIPTFYVERPHDIQCYPDSNPLLLEDACIKGGMDGDITGQLVVLRGESLALEHRTPRNQLWIATHGPGCQLHSFTGTVHLTHPIDGDRLCVGRHELFGVASPETIERMKSLYPALAAALEPEQEPGQDEDFCR